MNQITTLLDSVIKEPFKSQTCALPSSDQNSDTHVLVLNSVRPSAGTALLMHWGRVTHICVNALTIIGSDNGLYVAWSASSRYWEIWDFLGIQRVNECVFKLLTTHHDPHNAQTKRQNYCCHLHRINDIIYTLVTSVRNCMKQLKDPTCHRQV